jgi:hypothetical protein
VLNVSNFVKIIGVAIVIAGVGGALTLGFVSIGIGPTQWWQTRTYNYQPTVTPLAVTPAQVANLIGTQFLAFEGLEGTPTVTANEDGSLVVSYNGGMSDALLLAVGNVVGGQLELDYISAETVPTVVVEASDATVVVDTNLINQWYQRDLADNEFLVLLTS